MNDLNNYIKELELKNQELETKLNNWIKAEKADLENKVNKLYFSASCTPCVTFPNLTFDFNGKF